MTPESVSSAGYTLDLHVDYYPRPAIEQALVAFEAVAKLRVEWGDPYQRVTVEPGGAVPAEQLAREFANYVLTVAAVGGRAPTAPGGEGSGAPSGSP